jgi:hypothetical protein
MVENLVCKFSLILPPQIVQVSISDVQLVGGLREQNRGHLNQPAIYLL